MTTSLAPHPLLIPPALAKEIGLHEAVILQQMHYWLEKSNPLINGQQFQIQILTTGTVYLEDKGVFLQEHRDGADDTEFWGNAGISH